MIWYACTAMMFASTSCARRESVSLPEEDETRGLASILGISHKQAIVTMMPIVQRESFVAVSLIRVFLDIEPSIRWVDKASDFGGK